MSIQAQIVNLLETLQREFDLTYLFIAHDLAVVRHISDRIAVMYLGQIMELSPGDDLYDNPLHPYTISLLSAIPIPDPVVERQRESILLQGDLPSPAAPPAGLSFSHPLPVRTADALSRRRARAAPARGPPRQVPLGGEDQGGRDPAAATGGCVRAGRRRLSRLRAAADVGAALDEKRIDIRWRDLDAYGHVNQAVYLTFAEEALDDWFRRRLALDEGRVWDYVAARTTIEYRSELRLADVQAVGTVELVRLGTKSVTAKTTLRAPDGRVAAEIESVVVVLDGKGGASRAITDAERQALQAK